MNQWNGTKKSKTKYQKQTRRSGFFLVISIGNQQFSIYCWEQVRHDNRYILILLPLQNHDSIKHEYTWVNFINCSILHIVSLVWGPSGIQVNLGTRVSCGAVRLRSYECFDDSTIKYRPLYFNVIFISSIFIIFHNIMLLFIAWFCLAISRPPLRNSGYFFSYPSGCPEPTVTCQMWFQSC